MSPVIIIIISGLFAAATVALTAIATMARLSRLATIEARALETTTVLNASQLQQHFQQISFSIVEIDALKQDIINAAHKHHLTIDKSDTQPESLFKSPENRERLLKVMEKRQQQTARIS